MDQQAARDALVNALQALTAVASVAVLRRVLHNLIDDYALYMPGAADEGQCAHLPGQTAPNTTTPLAQGATNGVAFLASIDELPRATPPTHAEHTARRLPVKAAPRKGAASNGKSAALSVTAWLQLREQVKTTMRQRQLDLAGLAAAIGRSVGTTVNTMQKRSLPSTTILALLRAFAAGPAVGPEPAAAPATHSAPVTPSTPSTATAGPANGDLHTPLAAETVKALKAKRRTVPLTSHTLAGQLGLADGELARALAGEAVSTAAAERLQAWAAAG